MTTEMEETIKRVLDWEKDASVNVFLVPIETLSESIELAKELRELGFKCKVTPEMFVYKVEVERFSDYN
jgi:hypothetical protein